ncbi:hypothetical protein H5410_001310 [Solanum commersonii]|uniref:Uncharacterized protein n=1 Tax=Solanum commersonii TaxID=4109 RepID=A0A9J6AYU9_SOLCO|nr:hypothetical protein H5410_001310 [Solanum commersonii]
MLEAPVRPILPRSRVCAGYKVNAKSSNRSGENDQALIGEALEWRVLTGSLHLIVRTLHRLFNLHKCGRMARDLRRPEFDSEMGHCASGAFRRRNYGGKQEGVILWLARYIPEMAASEWSICFRPTFGHPEKATLTLWPSSSSSLLDRSVATKADNQVRVGQSGNAW